MENFQLALPSDTIVSFPLFIAISLTLTSTVTISQGPGQGTYWLPYDFKTCSETTVEAYTLATWGYIVVCPIFLPPNANPTVGDRDKVYPSDFRGGINTLGHTVSITILHEMVHALFPAGKYIL